MFDGQSDASDFQLKHLLGNRFVRLQIPLETGSEAMDDVSEKNMSALEQEAIRLIETHGEQIDLIVEKLSERFSGN